MDVSIIIVNWNTKKLLHDCLASIYKFTRDIDFEVIVVDNGSSDKSSDMVKKDFPQVKLVINKDNLGFTKANNKGIKIAKGKYILLLNSDTYLVENSLKKLITIANQKEKVGAIGPLLLNEDKSVQQSVGFFPHLPQVLWWMSFLDDLPFGYLLKPYHVNHDLFYKKPEDVDWVTGAAILVPRKVIDKVGLLDEQIFMYGEEVSGVIASKERATMYIFLQKIN
jgi:GT2 family glycosyltransferase